MFSLVRQGSLPPGCFQAGSGKHFHVKAMGISSFQAVAGIIILAAQVQLNRLIDYLRINEGTVAGNSYHMSRVMALDSLVKAIENIFRLPRKQSMACLAQSWAI